MTRLVFDEPQSGVLDSSVLAKFVDKEEIWVITLLKQRSLDPIQYIDGYMTSHKTLAENLGWSDSSIGFAGRLGSHIPGETTLNVGGHSLSRDFERSHPENMKAFELIEAMLAISSTKLEWENF